MAGYRPASERTMYFIGVTTGASSIMKVFPAWSRCLGLDAVIRGIDFSPDEDPARYREAVAFIKRDPLSLGALVTTHKVNLLKASRELFDRLDPLATVLGEVSSISKRDGNLIGHAKDPISAGAAFEAIVPEGHWRRTGAPICILGSGGSALALTLYVHNKSVAGGDVPPRILVTGNRRDSLSEMRDIHDRIGMGVRVDYALTESAGEADRIVGRLPPGSMVVNATGLGKDRPGSPLTDRVRFPEGGIVWEFNYRGELRFLAQAKAQENSRGLSISDGWVYFIHGWTRVISEVFAIDIPISGPAFDRMARIAREAAVVDGYWSPTVA